MDKLFRRLVKIYCKPGMKNDYEIVLRLYYRNPLKRKWEYSLKILKNGKHHNTYGCTPEFFDMCKKNSTRFRKDEYKSSQTVFLTYIPKMLCELIES